MQWQIAATGHCPVTSRYDAAAAITALKTTPVQKSLPLSMDHPFVCSFYYGPLEGTQDVTCALLGGPSTCYPRGMVRMTTSTSRALDSDNVVVIHGVSWEQYESVLELLGDSPGVRVAYLDGELEIVSPGRTHEYVKKLIARLLEAYAETLGIELNGFGSETLKRRPRRAGVEPDECYILGTDEKRFPDLAIEVAVTREALDKLEIYERLGVAELWVWEDGAISIHRLGPSGYKRARRSRLFPKLDVKRLAAIVATADPLRQSSTVRRFRESLDRGR